MFELSKQALEELGAEITSREIKQQPDLWQQAFDNYISKKDELENFIQKVVDSAAGKLVRVIFTGAGSSQYAGDAIVPYLKAFGNRQRFLFESVATTDIVSSPEYYLFADETVLLVSFARSGNSPESLATVDLANQIVDNVYHLVITCAADGQLAQQTKEEDNSFVLLMPEKSNDAGFAMTGSFTCMMLSAILIFDAKNETAVKSSYVQAAAKIGRDIINREAELQDLVDSDFNRIVYLGSGTLTGLTREAQLKILELTAGKLATNFDSSLGFRHGPKSFIDEKTVVLSFVNNNPYTRQYDVDMLDEIYSDGLAARVIGISQDSGLKARSENFGLLSQTILPDIYLSLDLVLVAQIIALLSSIKVGNTPDTPSASGTVNRVVKGVHIYDFKS